MKCPHCQMEWTDKAGVTNLLKNCPFCGGSLAPQKKNPQSLEECLKEIFRQFGATPFQNGKSLISVHSDLMPDRQRDRRLLTLLMFAEGNGFLLDTLKKPVSEQGVSISRLAKKMEEEWMLKPEAIREVCSAFWLAVGGGKDALKAFSEVPKKPAPVKNTPKPATPVSQTTQLPDLPPPPFPSYVVCNRRDFHVVNGVLRRYTGSESYISFPADVRVVGERTFDSCKFKEVYIPEGVTEIGTYSFHACSQMTSIHLPATLTKIGESAFQSCWSLKEVRIPGSAGNTGRYSFYACNGLRRVVLGEGLWRIDDYAFWKCSWLKEIVIPDSLKQISINAFQDCKGIKVIASEQWKKNHPDLLKYIPQ